MISYHDYFRQEDRGAPYCASSGHLTDCLRLVSMFLDACQEKKADCAAGLSQALDHVARREELSAAAGFALPAVTLFNRFSMGVSERLLFLFALAPELDIQYGCLYGSIQGNPACVCPSLGLCKLLLSLCPQTEEETIYRFTDESIPYVRLCFVRPDQSSQSLLYQNLILKKQVVLFLLQISYLPFPLRQSCTRLSELLDENFCCNSALYENLQRVGKQMKTQHFDGLTMLIQLNGPDGCGRRFLLSRLAKEQGREILSLDLQPLSEMDRQELSSVMEDLATELVLTGSLLHLRHAQTASEDGLRRALAVVSYVCRFCRPPVLFLSAPEDCAPIRGDFFFNVTLPAFRLSSAARIPVWTYFAKAFSISDEVDVSAIAQSCFLTPGAIRRALREADAIRVLAGDDTIGKKQLSSAITSQSPPAFGGLAVKIPATYGWDDLELPNKQKELLLLACGRVRHKALVEETWGIGRKRSYGKGLSLLFYGPPGTGKTMAAQVLSTELGLGLYRVDLSQTASKYIGETEKHIHNLFSEAKRTGVILFFDEADSLFAKRTEVANSNDRHANAETSYILQELEEYDGVTVLATNLYQNFDNAFLRRITYTIRFEMPDPTARLRLWKNILPKEAPLSQEIDFKFLAEKFELSGSAIKSILLSAAYLAAADDTAIGPRQIVRAMQYEFLKIGKMVSPEEFEHYRVYL